ncbi:serine/threonine-protein kinase [Paraliomyxa miuraensis]|uniref:serine/threonine-protein kinase n=1 Tax=Paraliomyxa miuraensis TaxID=376150 RepID=UPI00224F5584|nr:serine/threonine-protein kinase [Paraliomyxa miuraensis]MCX4241213.1 serine/threonine-protein kinase [Paraliomyxa miuraensis]
MDIQLRMVQAAVEAQLFGKPTHPVSVGRYTVLGPIGSGGMGSVMRAFDPELQREVALKLLRAERMGDASTRARLVQEARAMARLSHPNVAMVFEVGEADGHLFVAMELIDGRDLRAWLDEAPPRPWRDVLGLFEQAGRGLAAAHAKGLIHRDFKPENVVVDAEGRARVVDFGLAREQADGAATTEDGSEPAPPVALPPGRLDTATPASLTATGTLLGTPAYMSPEQWLGHAVDARSDQFSFCVSLWEALLGERPFPGEDASSLMKAVTSGRVADSKAGAVPGRILRALRRGLSVDPEQRWPDMDALLAALRPRARGSVLVGGVVVVALAGTVAMAMRVEGSPGDECSHEAERLADVWDEPAREASGRGVHATALPYADDVWNALAPRLDAYADEWVEAAQQSCIGALVSTEAATARRARQQRCLEDARTALDLLADGLVTADEATVVDAAHAATRLPDLGACADDRRLMAWPTDDSPEREAAVTRARRALARARRSLAVLDTSEGNDHYDAELAAGRDAATEAQQAAREAGHRSLEAEAALAQGRLLLKAGEKPAAEQALLVAMEGAESSGDELTRLRARIYQVYVLGTDRDRTDQAIRLGEQSLAQLDGLGPRPLLRARLLGNMATAVARARRPDHERALALHHEAITLLEQELGEHHPHLITARLNLGRALSYARRYEDSEAQLRLALARAQEVWGDDHPHTARILGTLGLTLGSLGRYDEAEQALRRSLEARERILGPEHQEVASALYNLGTVLRRADRHDEAVVVLRRGLAIRRRRADPDEDGLMPWLYALGDSEITRGNAAAGREVLTEALALAESDGASPFDFARVRFGLAQATAAEDPTAARVMARAARDSFESHGHTERAARVDAFLKRLESGREAEDLVRESPAPSFPPSP